MKKKSILGLFAILFGFSLSLTSCEDMLTPDMDRNSEGFTGKDTVNFYLGILRNVQGMIEQNIILGEIRGDLTTTTSYTSDSIADIANFKQTPDGENELLNRAAYYKVINQCNFYLSKVDSTATKNGFQYMARETAQVLLIRAWTYLQLVQNYGSVPFITEPVDNANTGWETTAPKATPDNLVELLKTDCEQAMSYERNSSIGLPQYGSFNTGATSYSHSALIFPADIVTADLYLLRGQPNDYREAAKLYYHFFDNNNSPSRWVDAYKATFSSHYRTIGGVREEYFQPSVSAWANLFQSSTVSRETVTMIPSAANTAFGKVLTRVQQIYGFDPSSSTSTTESEDDSGNTSTSSSGTISVTANYKNRQIAPSSRYEAINKAQNYYNYDNRTETNSTYLTEGDARYYGTVPEVTTEIGRLRFIQKYCGSGTYQATRYSFNFPYILRVYRLHQLHLRYAEALNRCGYPRLAFAVLRGGLNPDFLPTEYTSYFSSSDTWVPDTIYDDDAKTRQLVYRVEVDTTTAAGYHSYFVNADVIRKIQADPDKSTMLLFSGLAWQNSGLHDLGTNNFLVLKDSLNDYGLAVAQRIEDEQLRVNGSVSPEAKKVIDALRAETRNLGVVEPDTAWTPELDSIRHTDAYTTLQPEAYAEASAYEIDAVESLIADESALELGFEGYRYFDLMRLARHKNSDTSGLFSADYGTNWFAWQIARRNTEYKLYENPSVYDAGIYGTLINQENWYLQNPKY